MPEILGTLKPPRLASAPSSPALGQIYYNTATNKLYWYNGSAWVAAEDAGAVAITDAQLPSRIRLNASLNQITNWNNAVESGWYAAAGAANEPIVGWGWIVGEVIAFSSSYIEQRVWMIEQPVGVRKTYIRYMVAGVWEAWHTEPYRSATTILRIDDAFHVGVGQPLILNNGSPAVPQIELAYVGSVRQYRSRISTQHHGGLSSENWIDFYVWSMVDSADDLASVRTLRLAGDGKLWIGNAYDTNLYRLAADVLKTDDSFEAAAAISAIQSGTVRTVLGGAASGAGSPNTYLALYYDTVNNRGELAALSGGVAWRDIALAPNASVLINKIWFGVPGTFDTSLYRSAAGKLRTDGTLDANALTINGVPVGSGGGGAGVDYIGNWAAGTAYKKGDVVRYNGVDYLAVNDSTGQAPPATVAIPSLTIGTTLPASPGDGQEAILVDSLTAPTYSWRFRYLASITGANKWLFVGGSPAYILATGGTMTTAVYADFPSNASFTVPRAGDYLIRFGAPIYGSTPQEIRVSIKKGAAATSDADAISQQNIAATNHVISLARTIKAAGLAASDILKTQGKATSAAITAQSLFMEITPVVVS